jgi:hypothetical protein
MQYNPQVNMKTETMPKPLARRFEISKVKLFTSFFSAITLTIPETIAIEKTIAKIIK